MKLTKKEKDCICYVQSKNFGPYYLPVRYQYLIQRDYISKIDKSFILPQGEPVFSKTSIRLRSLVSKMRNNNILILISVFMLPDNNQTRINLLKLIIKKKIKIHCIFENIIAKNKFEILNLNKRFKLNKVL
jgi:sporadic carbohydrate cluster protein (TIGR04323 family)